MKRRNRSLWREECLLLHLLQSAVNPQLSLADCLPNWAAISLQLREAPRKRQLQAAHIEADLLALY